MSLESVNMLLAARINRYIVGCKFCIFNTVDTGFKGINRYIVGCKYEYDCGIDSNQGRINRYIVGCKYSYIWRNHYCCIELIDT